MYFWSDLRLIYINNIIDSIFKRKCLFWLTELEVCCPDSKQHSLFIVQILCDYCFPCKFCGSLFTVQILCDLQFTDQMKMPTSYRNYKKINKSLIRRVQ